MNGIDVVLVGLAVLFAVVGWRTGFVQGLIGFAGFLLGVVLAARLVPDITNGIGSGQTVRALIIVGLVLCAGLLGHAVGAFAGGRLRRRVETGPVRWVDSTLGAALAGAGVVVAAWGIGAILLALPENPATGQVRDSRVLAAVDSGVPGGAKEALSELAAMVNDVGIPIVTGGFGGAAGAAGPPSTSEATTAEVSAVLGSVVRVSGNKPRCGSGATGSGYVSTAEHVTTNAHVVAAMESPHVTTNAGKDYRAVVVAFDPIVDVAVLYVPDLPLAPIPTVVQTETGTRGAVAGYPGGGPLTVTGAVVRAQITGGTALATDIYGNPGQPRAALILTTQVRPGDSGGPLLTEGGQVMGLVFAQALEDSQVGYALTAEQFRTLSRSAGAATTGVPTGGCPAR